MKIKEINKDTKRNKQKRKNKNDPDRLKK